MSFGDKLVERTMKKLFEMASAEKPDIEKMKEILDKASKKGYFYITKGNVLDHSFIDSNKSYLVEAMNKGYNELAKLFIEYGADVNLLVFIDHKKIYPLRLAIEKNNRDMVKLLVEHGADVNRENEYGKTVLDYTSDKEIEKYLKKHGAKTRLDERIDKVQKLFDPDKELSREEFEAFIKSYEEAFAETKTEVKKSRKENEKYPKKDDKSK